MTDFYPLFAFPADIIANEMSTYPLLLHEFGMRSVIHNITPPTRSRKSIIDLFRVQIGLLAIQDEVVPFRSEVRCDLPAEHDESEYIAILQNSIKKSQPSLHPRKTITKDQSSNLCLAFFQELSGLLTIGNGASYEGEPMEHNRWLIFLLEEDLFENI